MSPIELANETQKILDNKKALDIKVLKVEDVSILSDYMVIATGTSSTHVNALADELEYKLKQVGIVPSHVEGHRSNSWILLDYSSVVVHIFSNEARSFYNLERLWENL